MASRRSSQLSYSREVAGSVAKRAAGVTGRPGGLPGDRRGKRTHMIGALILGLVAGYLAKALLPGDDPGGFLVTIALGLVGSLVGFFIFTELLGIGDSDIFDLGGLIGAVIGTMILLLGYRQVAART